MVIPDNVDFDRERMKQNFSPSSFFPLYTTALGVRPLIKSVVSQSGEKFWKPFVATLPDQCGPNVRPLTAAFCEAVEVQATKQLMVLPSAVGPGESKAGVNFNPPYTEAFWTL